jgi:hypothetical protein
MARNMFHVEQKIWTGGLVVPRGTRSNYIAHDVVMCIIEMSYNGNF